MHLKSYQIDGRLLRTGAANFSASSETLHIRQLENGLERPCGRSRPTPWRFASLVGTDAFAGALTRGSIGTIPAPVETENTRSYQGGVWLGDLDSNQD